MFYDTKDVIIDKLKYEKFISLTTDGWKSLTHNSYITVTAHICTEDFKLESFVLDTSEMKDRHTSENLIKHVDEVLIDFDLKEKNLAINFTHTDKNKDDITSQDTSKDVDELVVLNVGELGDNNG